MVQVRMSSSIEVTVGPEATKDELRAVTGDGIADLASVAYRVESQDLVDQLLDQRVPIVRNT
jgi:hypothetical protein